MQVYNRPPHIWCPLPIVTLWTACWLSSRQTKKSKLQGSNYYTVKVQVTQLALWVNRWCCAVGRAMGWTHKRRKKWWWRTLVCYTQKGPSTRVLKLSIRKCNCRDATQFRIQRHRLSFLPAIFILVLFLLLYSSTSPSSYVLHCHFSFFPHVLPMALLNAQHHPLLLVYYLNCLICTFQIKKKLFFHATYSSWTTLMMKAETSSEMSVTMILTNQQSIILHKTWIPKYQSVFSNFNYCVGNRGRADKNYLWCRFLPYCQGNIFKNS